VVGLLLLVPPAAAQWSRVTELPASDVFTVWATGDTIVAADSVVYVSTNAGATWKRSARLGTGVAIIPVALVHNGRLYAGTHGQGVFASNDLGTTWAGFSQGLVGGIGNSVLTIMGLVVQGPTLYAATEGAGPWARNLASGEWAHFSANTIESFQAANMDGGIASGGTRLLAGGGFNGTVFVRDPGQPDWTVSLLLNDRFGPGLAPLNAIWTGRRWVVGTNIGMYHSATGREPWTYVDLGVHGAFFAGLATTGGDLFGSLGTGGGSLIARSSDDGVNWQNLDTLFAVSVYRLAIHETDLYASRTDGLWRRSIATPVSVPGPGSPAGLALGIVGSQLIGDEARFRFNLPVPGPIVLEFFDITGRRAAESIRGSWAAGAHEITWSTRELRPGVYMARLSAGGEQAVARVVHAR
jgi:hypothetical protein